MKNLKTNQKRALVVVPIFLIILAGAGLATAQGMGHGKGIGGGPGDGLDCEGPGFGPGHRLEMMAHRLDLSEDQQANIKKIFEEGRKDGLEKRKELMRLRNEMHGEMLKDNPSEKTVLGINSKMGDLKTEMKALRLKARLAVRLALTPQQRDQMLLMGGPGGHDGCGKKGGRGGHHGQRGSKGFGGCDGSGGGSCSGGGPGFHRGGNFGGE